MKSLTIILSIFLSCNICAQTNSISLNQTIFEESREDNSLKSHFASNLYFEQTTKPFENPQQLRHGETVTNFNHSNFALSPPLLTTCSQALEICAGNSTQLTASSNNTIYWYTTPPPLGNPVGTGTSLVTPELSAGYYTYYAVAENNGLTSDITAMEVVMVYPNPTITITSNIRNLCANETATLTVSGTTYYEWENGPVSSKITIRPTTSQEFKVTGINTAGCSSSAVYMQSVITCSTHHSNEILSKQFTNIDDIQTNQKLFTVYPNPNNGDFNISVNTISESTRIEIYNGVGSLVYSEKIINELSNVNLSDYSNGIYIVRIIENNKVLNQEKVIKE
ncbi:T9SS type A sorting domain-containing protein [Aurantibacillus circumpalustris]|uniref:T9SS type A sorting domain-containing protein n=1 Tax=Aurantibacillus circumpalustris TaxID=3036359 RepID=UPI00295BE4DD|nr:T9SS type A sorting domain-containing protein [Aurantibacillus circumpalustris]